MDRLGFVTDKQLQLYIRLKKTELSCMEDPRVSLSQMRDNGLVKEDMYKRVMAMRSRERIQKYVYDILEQLEKENPRKARIFWNCMFKDSILQRNPTLRQMKDSLVEECCKFEEILDNTEPEAEKTCDGKGMKKSSAKKRKADEDPGPSSAVKKSAKKRSVAPLKKGDQQEMWKWPLYRNQLPVTCGDKVGFLHRDKLTKGQRCILSENRWYTPGKFEEFGGKGGSKNWKVSIRCRNKTLKYLIEGGHLQCPDLRRRTTL